MFSCLGRIQKFFRKGAPNFDIFLSAVFGRIILKHIENKKGSRGSGGMLPRKIYINLHTVAAILVLFEQVLGKFCLNFLPLILSVAPSMMHFVHTFSIMRAYGVKLIGIEKIRNYGKVLFNKTCLKMAGSAHAVIKCTIIMQWFTSLTMPMTKTN